MIDEALKDGAAAGRKIAEAKALIDEQLDLRAIGLEGDRSTPQHSHVSDLAIAAAQRRASD